MPSMNIFFIQICIFFSFFVSSNNLGSTKYLYSYLEPARRNFLCQSSLILDINYIANTESASFLHFQTFFNSCLLPIAKERITSSNRIVYSYLGLKLPCFDEKKIGKYWIPLFRPHHRYQTSRPRLVSQTFSYHSHGTRSPEGAGLLEVCKISLFQLQSQNF